jgi:hypothetical protein
LKGAAWCLARGDDRSWALLAESPCWRHMCIWARRNFSFAHARCLSGI